MKRSERKKWIDKCRVLIRKQKIKLYGNRCQFCGSNKQVGLFHILSVGAYPRLELYEDNILLACWFGCHHKWHHDFYYARDVIEPKIIKILGKNYEQDLKDVYNTLPKLGLMRIKEIYEELKEKDK